MRRTAPITACLGMFGFIAGFTWLGRSPDALAAYRAVAPAAPPTAAETARPQDAEDDDATGREQDAGEQDEQGGDDAKPPAPARPQRVVVQTGASQFAHGTIAQETDTILTLDTDSGIQTFIKSRIIRLTRLVEPAPGQRGVVFLRDGARREGVILADEYDGVMLEIAGVRSRFDRAAVERVELLPTVRERYAQIKASMQPEHFDRRFELCRWLLDVGEFRLALEEVVSLKHDNPRHDGIDALLRQVRAHVALLADESESEIQHFEGARPPGGSGSSGPVSEADLLPAEILTREQVNLIRVYELDFINPPPLNVSADTIRALVMQYGSHPSIPASADERASLFRADPLDIVRLMFEVRARDLYSQIEVQGEPYSLNLFQHRVHNTWLIKNCATSQCHGGVHAGRFFLHARNHRDERVRYTNLLILERLELDGRPPLINWDEPTMSLILQYALPITEARHPHPDVPGWRPAIGPGERRLVEDFVKWVRAMYMPRPQYPVDYTPPKLHGQSSPEDSFTNDRVDR